MQYTLLKDLNGVSSPDFSLSQTTLDIGGQNYSLSLSNNSTEELLTVALDSGYYFTGVQSGSLSDIGNFATDHAGAVAQVGSFSNVSNVFLTADSASNYASQTLDGSYTINSLSFTGTNSAASAIRRMGHELDSPLR